MTIFIPILNKNIIIMKKKQQIFYQIADGIGVAVTVHFNVTISPAFEIIGDND